MSAVVTSLFRLVAIENSKLAQAKTTSIFSTGHGTKGEARGAGDGTLQGTSPWERARRRGTSGIEHGVGSIRSGVPWPARARS